MAGLTLVNMPLAVSAHSRCSGKGTRGNLGFEVQWARMEKEAGARLGGAETTDPCGWACDGGPDGSLGSNFWVLEDKHSIFKLLGRRQKLQTVGSRSNLCGATPRSLSHHPKTGWIPQCISASP